MEGFRRDDRAVTESTGVVILVGITIVVTGLVGLNVLIGTDEGPSGPSANFSYDHVEDSGALIVTHVEGDAFPAGDIVIVGDDAETTWAEAGSVDESEEIGPGDIVQVSEGNSYGEPVTERSTVRIFYEQGENRTQLSEWVGRDAEASGFRLQRLQPLMLQTGNVRATLSPMPRASETRTTSSTSL
ncbi:type IV pilin N-terminal domain-containing protein [Halobacteria archaeon HArc-gm2]|nr:type IV pilin N-terminal domain-containing protein [Halobacteria archaeon HArc-gm2]